MHCHKTFNYNSTNGTSGLRNHRSKCSPGTQKRPRQHENTPLPYIQKSTADPKQKKLPFLVSSKNKCMGTSDEIPEQDLAFLDTHTDKNGKKQEVDQNGPHEVLAAPELSTDQQKNQIHGETLLPEQDFPNDLSQKNQKVDQNCSPEELVRILAIHGLLPRILEQDGFRKAVACLNPMVSMPSHYDFIGNICDLFQQEKSKLKDKLAALHSRVCLSAYIWNYDPHLAFLCLSVHYIDDEWEKQQKIITFSPVDPSCDAKESSNVILGAIREWGLHDKVFSIIMDDAFIDDSVASNVKASLQKWSEAAANLNLFVVRSATHLLDHVIQVGLDELDRIMEKSAKCPKYAKGSNRVAVRYPNSRYAPSPKDWRTANKICEILRDFHEHIDLMPNLPGPADLFGTLRKVYRKADFESRYESDEAFSKVLDKIKQKFKERWKHCFLHFCMPMVMDPKYSLKCIELFIKGNEKDDYIHEVCDTFVNLFNEYLDQVDYPHCTSRSETSKGTVENADTLLRYYQDSKHQSCERPLTELGQYLQETRPASGKPSVLQWWKEHSLTYPTIAQMARDILALPCITACKVATRTAGLAMCESADKSRIEMLVCTQDWLTPAGMSI
ncbi:zinc finger BED domain-containing protein RICESLEEPER 2-like [Panicum virgatum]|uniref:zinc finger BED domain-containing protein RICESLEEPER 2-like n=1 Tax=Panicum virgatum TaxID=38727 RepID=UPI0019D692BE|nr:zinc finger BED domain-containing protein RICESLEEPER 2-like [Panicum virgatum]